MAIHLPVGIYAIPEVSMVGATEEELTRQKIPYETGIARYKEISRTLAMARSGGRDTQDRESAMCVGFQPIRCCARMGKTSAGRPAAARVTRNPAERQRLSTRPTT